MNKNLNTRGWVSETNQKPPLKDGEPMEVELLTDFDDDILEGYYDDGTWWIKLTSPAVGHQDYRTFSLNFEITHWRGAMNQYESSIEFVKHNKGKLFLEGFEVVKLDSFIESEYDREPCYKVIKFIGCPPRFYYEEVPIIIGLTPLEKLPDYLDIVNHWDMNFELVGGVACGSANSIKCLCSA